MTIQKAFKVLDWLVLTTFIVVGFQIVGLLGLVEGVAFWFIWRVLVKATGIWPHDS